MSTGERARAVREHGSGMVEGRVRVLLLLCSRVDQFLQKMDGAAAACWLTGARPSVHPLRVQWSFSLGKKLSWLSMTCRTEGPWAQPMHVFQ